MEMRTEVGPIQNTEENTGRTPQSREHDAKCKMKRILRGKQKDQIEKDIVRYGKDILNSEELQQAYRQTHHTWSTVGEHTIRVAAASLLICYALRKIHVQTDISAVVEASLCHDLGILGRYEKYTSDKECMRQHPVDSVEVARGLVDDLSEKSAGIIERHMWPAGHSKAPNSIEGVIVSTADKYAALQDIVEGSAVKHTGVKIFARDLKSRTQAELAEFLSDWESA